MGMFDRVWATCPSCGNEIEFQSKAGECILNDYSIYSVPPEIAVSLDGDYECCQNCGKEVQILVEKVPERVRMKLV